MVVRGCDVDEPGRARGVDEALHRGRGLLRVWHVELARRLHEVDLRVDVPENRPGHGVMLPTGLEPGVEKLDAALERGATSLPVQLGHDEREDHLAQLLVELLAHRPA